MDRWSSCPKRNAAYDEVTPTVPIKKIAGIVTGKPVGLALKTNIATALLPAAVVVPSQAAGPYIYVANAGEDTVSKIDVSNNTEVARYATWFTAPDPHHIAHNNNHPVTGPFPGTFYDKAHQGPGPSRIARDSAGNVFVLDRFFSTTTPGGSTNAPHLPVLLKIAVNPSGTTSS